MDITALMAERKQQIVFLDYKVDVFNELVQFATDNKNKVCLVADRKTDKSKNLHKIDSNVEAVIPIYYLDNDNIPLRVGYHGELKGWEASELPKVEREVILYLMDGLVSLSSVKESLIKKATVIFIYVPPSLSGIHLSIDLGSSTIQQTISETE